MIESFLRSPFTMSIFLIGISIISACVIIGNRGYSYLFIVIGFALFTISYLGMLVYYNYKYPHRKIPIVTYVPYELKEEDEGHQHITYRACRKVYIYYYFAIPVSILLVTILKDIQWIPVFILAGLGLGQYLVFWTEIRKLRD